MRIHIQSKTFGMVSCWPSMRSEQTRLCFAIRIHYPNVQWRTSGFCLLSLHYNIALMMHIHFSTSLLSFGVVIVVLSLSRSAAWQSDSMKPSSTPNLLLALLFVIKISSAIITSNKTCFRAVGRFDELKDGKRKEFLESEYADFSRRTPYHGSRLTVLNCNSKQFLNALSYVDWLPLDSFICYI